MNDHEHIWERADGEYPNEVYRCVVEGCDEVGYPVRTAS